ncbi:MAG TPA: tripartite tricarboxylate transporter substrate-binding protein [Alphaproteobacteria bacterium]|nr:tripartite tricarboxylate transporter substrate-binding protein [Alphaproteobacteria bacterium]
MARATVVILCVLAMAVGLSRPAAADDVAEFYKGRTLTMVVGFPPGGLNDLSARLVARYMVKYLPGSPRQVVQNMPGAGGLTSTNYLYNVAPKDGTVVAGILRSIPQTAYLGDPNIRFDPAKFNWLGSTSSFADDAYALFIMSDRPVKSWAALKATQKPVMIGAVGVDIKLTFSLFVRDILKGNVAVTHGYRGAAELFLAMQTGEIDSQFNSLSSTKAAQGTLWRDGKFRALVQFGRQTRHPELPDAPTGQELVSNPDDLALLKFTEAPLYMSLPFAAPPGVPAERIKALRAAFDKAHKDPDFLAEAAKSELDVSPIDGDAIARLVEDMSKAPPAIVKKFEAISTLR